MKKFLTVFLAFAMSLSLCACGKDNDEGTNQNKEVQKVSQDDKKTDELSELKSIYNDNSFSFEEMEYELVLAGTEGECTNLYLKVRNNTEEKIDLVEFSMQALDANGDVLYEREGGSIEDLEPGQGGWTDSCQMYQVPKNKIDKIKILGYSVSKREEGKSNVYLSLYTCNYEKPIYFNMSDFTEK